VHANITKTEVVDDKILSLPIHFTPYDVDGEKSWKGLQQLLRELGARTDQVDIGIKAFLH
jgi:hypothetical protein